MCVRSLKGARDSRAYIPTPEYEKRAKEKKNVFLPRDPSRPCHARRKTSTLITRELKCPTWMTAYNLLALSARVAEMIGNRQVASICNNGTAGIVRLHS